MNRIKVLFCDIGGVLLTNGWDRNSRIKAAKQFDFDFDEMQVRHKLIFSNYESGKITLEQYLHYVVFFESRSFTMDTFIKFMYHESQALPGMISLIQSLKDKHGLKIVFLSNEGRELTNYRLKTFGLDKLGDFFLVSCFTGICKPDLSIFRMALDFVQIPPNQTAYLDDRQLFVEIARDMGIKAIHHTDETATKHLFEKLLTNKM